MSEPDSHGTPEAISQPVVGQRLALSADDEHEQVSPQQTEKQEMIQPQNDDSGTTATSAKLQELHIDTSQRPSSPQKGLPITPPPPEPPSDLDQPYDDPTPKTPSISRRASRRKPANEMEGNEGVLIDLPAEVSHTGKAREDADNESSSEIQSIMEQFTDGMAAPTKDEIMSPRQETANPFLGEPGKFPPRRSSLEPLRSRDMDAIAHSPVVAMSEKFPASPPPVPPKPDVSSIKSPPQSLRNVSTTSSSKQLPEPEPEPELPFDFHRFLEQLRHKSADPVAKFLRSFLTEFGKKQWMVHEQVKIISDFLAFITNKMAQCEVWREVSDNEFDNAKEGMEKLVMNRLYSQTFSPALPSPQQPARGRGKRREPEKFKGPGRRGQHQEDVERDEILTQKIRIYSWVREEHLDIPAVGPNGERFLRLAQQELLKIRTYRAPRDKVVCILNCCKVIFGLLKNSQSSDTSADSFVPLLIFVILQANPEHLVSNIQYILRFRNQDKLSGESGYYLSSLSGAITFIEGLDRTTLTVTDEDFERNVELAVSAIAEQNRSTDAPSPQTERMSEKTSLAEADITPRSSIDIKPSSPRKAVSRDPISRSGPSASSDGFDEGPAAGLLKSIQKPLSTIGKIFSDQDVSQEERPEGGVPPKRLNPPAFQPNQEKSSESAQARRRSPGHTRPNVVSYDAEEAAARQASAEAAEARRIQRAEHKTVVDTLCGMFPNLDREVIDDVVRQKQGRVGLAVDACLSLTAGG